MAEEKKGHLSETPWQMLDAGFRFYKLPRMIAESLGYGASIPHLILKIATFADGQLLAKRRTSLNSDSQLMRKLRNGYASIEDLKFVFSKLVKSTSRISNLTIFEQPIEMQNSAAGYLQTVVDGILIDNPEKPLEPFWTLVLEYYQELLKIEHARIELVSSIKNDSERKQTAARIFLEVLDIDFENSILNNAEQDFFARAGVLRFFSAAMELSMSSNLETMRNSPSHFAKLLPEIDSQGRIIFSSKKLINSMFLRWKQNNLSNACKKIDFYKFITNHIQNTNDELSKVNPEFSTIKKRINRWESGEVKIPFNQFWSMFDWAFTETHENGEISDKPPLQMAMLLMCVNLFSENQKLGLSIGVPQERIVEFYGDYLSVSSQEKISFDDFLSKKNKPLVWLYNYYIFQSSAAKSMPFCKIVQVLR